MISATLAVYPLGQADYTAVDEAIDRLRATGVTVDVGSMHTQIEGDEASVFAALQPRAPCGCSCRGGPAPAHRDLLSEPGRVLKSGQRRPQCRYARVRLRIARLDRR
jgi:hypothetical protein